jgi:ribulose-5-phosphate 4-epimerase/fuculose-1-phosphate aldolase
MKASDLVLVDPNGSVIYGKYPIVNPAGWAIHHVLHEHRPDIVAAAHAHTPAGTAFSAFGEPLIPYAQDSCAIYGRHAVFDGLPLIGDTVEAKKMAELLGEENVMVIARNHGLFTVGDSVDACLWWFLLSERVCGYNLAIRATGGKAVEIPHEVAVKARDGGLAGTLAGWFGFQPHYAEISEEQPELADD